MSAHISSNLRDESIKPNWFKIENFLSNKTKLLQCLLNFNTQTKHALSFLFYQKKLWVLVIILQNGTKCHVKFLVKRYSFSILASRGKKKSQKNPHPPRKKFGILVETKYTRENFSILHFIIPK
jgi:hypothetical protein